MRGFLLFAAGILIGAAIQATGAQSPPSQPPLRLNHVAISVPDINQALTWYSEKLGFREVVRNTNPQGQLMAAYIQVSRDTFIELQQSNPQMRSARNHQRIRVANQSALWTELSNESPVGGHAPLPGRRSARSCSVIIARSASPGRPSGACAKWSSRNAGGTSP